MNEILNFYKDKKVFITGHTGFKGTWLCKILKIAGAEVTGYGLKPCTVPALFEISEMKNDVNSIIGDIRDIEFLKESIKEVQPEIVIHMAAQPIVRESYKNPRYTYETNVMGTVNLFEAIRECNSVKSVVNVTTDKVYKNNEWEWGYRENEELCGFDPYSNSKSCSELVTYSYINSFFNSENSIAISTARAGNVIGGGDFSVDRIIPDCVRSALSNEDIIIRNPNSIRPYQHVLEPLFAYLTLAKEQYLKKEIAGAYNIGPDECDCVTTGELVSMFVNCWGDGISVIKNPTNDNLHEASFLKLDNSKVKNILKVRPRWNIRTAVEKTVSFTKKYAIDKVHPSKIMEEQIREFFA